jgi:hypothetical protein
LYEALLLSAPQQFGEILISRLMTVSVVQLLEVIDINHQ